MKVGFNINMVPTATRIVGSYPDWRDVQHWVFQHKVSLMRSCDVNWEWRRPESYHLFSDNCLLNEDLLNLIC